VVETLRDMTDQKRAETALQNLAAHDGLTGLANRRSFDQRLDMEWSRAQRAHAPITLVLADVDHFKLFNDVHGHQKGDDCLRAVAATMRSGILRPGDLAARYGGEEFAIIMPNTDLKGACKVAERLRTAVLDLQLKHGAAGAGRHVTMSMGVATVVPPAGVGPEWLLEQADQALYAAKDAGRNFVAAARETLVRAPQRKAGGRSR
jgi:diguanylate cyclase (GGDEF)-like protein